MAINRNIVPGAYLTGAAFGQDLADTLNYVGGLSLWRTVSVGGSANAITASIREGTGFSSLTDGAFATLTPSSPNSGAVTLALNGGSAISVRRNDGAPLQANDIVAGKFYPIQYNISDGRWYLLVDVLSQAVSTAPVPMAPYSFIEQFIGNGTWTAPFDCRTRVWCLGPGGAGARNASGGSRGGGGGGMAILTDKYMTTGQQFSITVPAGPAATANGSNGANGSNTLVTGPGGVSLAGNGGTGGSLGTGSGAPGGSATGGTVNITGQAGAPIAGSFNGAGGVFRPSEHLSSGMASDRTSTWKLMEDSWVSAIGPFAFLDRWCSGSTPGAVIAARGMGGAGTLNSPSGVNTYTPGGGGLVIVEWSGPI